MNTIGSWPTEILPGLHARAWALSVISSRRSPQLAPANRKTPGLRQTSRAARGSKEAGRNPLRSLDSSRSVMSAYVGSGLQRFVGGTVIVWMPSYFNGYYGMDTDKAGIMAASIVM